MLAACSDPAAIDGDTAESPGAATEWAVYEGAWFTIQYPATFTVVPSLASDDDEGYDSVFFNAPGDRAGFYVLSPQWGRAATDIALQPSLEDQVSEVEKNAEGRRTRTRTIRARDKSYERQVEEHREQGGTVFWVFQFRYANDEVRQELAGDYRRFRDSLKQYAD